VRFKQIETFFHAQFLFLEFSWKFL